MPETDTDNTLDCSTDVQVRKGTMSLSVHIVFFVEMKRAASNQHLKDIFALFVYKLTSIYSSHTHRLEHKESYSPAHWYADTHMHKHKQAP